MSAATLTMIFNRCAVLVAYYLNGILILYVFFIIGAALGQGSKLPKWNFNVYFLIMLGGLRPKD